MKGRSDDTSYSIGTDHSQTLQGMQLQYDITSEGYETQTDSDVITEVVEFTFLLCILNHGNGVPFYLQLTYDVFSLIEIKILQTF